MKTKRIKQLPRGAKFVCTYVEGVNLYVTKSGAKYFVRRVYEFGRKLDVVERIIDTDKIKSYKILVEY